MKIFCRVMLLLLLWLFVVACRSQSLANNFQPDKAFTLQTTLLEGKMVYIGIGGEIDGLVNPDLEVQSGDSVSVILESGDGISHDFAISELNIQSQLVTGKSTSTNMIFEIEDTGNFSYFCTVPGHRQAGMEGRLIIH